MKLLVTGGAGFIGSHITDALLAQGHDVHVLDNLSSGRREHLPSNVPLHVHDIRSPYVEDLFAQHQYEGLIHHAAQMDVRKSVEDPSFDADVNIRGFLNLMEAGRRNGLQSVVFASTGGAIYGEPVYAPQDEDHPLRPLSPYGIAKLATEKYLAAYRELYDIRSVCLRYANVYGPRQGAQGDAGVVAIFTRQLLNGKTPTINGTGTQTRDYVYVKDVVQANLAALDYDRSGVFNVGTGHETSVNGLFHLLRDATETSCTPAYGPANPGEQQRSILDNTKSHTELNWAPHVSLRDGLRDTVDWFRAQISNTQPA